VGRLLLYDALKMKVREIPFQKDAECPICGHNPSIKGLVDYEAFCASAGTDVPQVSARELKQKVEAGDSLLILDVREKEEWEVERIENSLLIPLSELEARMSELENYKTTEIIVHCQGGLRSRKACELLGSHQFETLFNLEGGLEAWKQI